MQPALAVVCHGLGVAQFRGTAARIGHAQDPRQSQGKRPPPPHESPGKDQNPDPTSPHGTSRVTVGGSGRQDLNLRPAGPRPRPAQGLVPDESGQASRPCHPETGKPLDRSKLVRRFKQAIDRAGVHRITFHELRHTFGTRMAAAGTPMTTLQHWMGHADSKTTQI